MSRLFFALWPPPACQEAIELTGAGASAGRGRAIPAANLHLTLRFLGPTTTEQRRCVEKAASLIDTVAFTLTLDTIGHWPRPKVLWSAPSATPAALQDLVAKLGPRIDECGFVPDTRPFRPHITLARKVSATMRTIHHEPVEWRVEDFVLVESDTLPSRVVYRVQKRWPLAIQDARGSVIIPG